MSKAGMTGMTKILSYLRGFFAKDSEVIKTINQKAPDVNGEYDLRVVDAARQLETDEAQQIEGTFISRTAGGDASIYDGTAVVMRIRGNIRHTGEVQEVLDMDLTEAAREEGQEGISAALDEDAFRAAVSASATITLLYTSAWSSDPADYGVTVTGTPKAGDTITITYVKGSRGTIATAQPTALRATGYNLYNHTAGYAYVKKYSSQYGFLVGGAWTGLQYSETEEGARTAITPASGYFDVPGDGYVWVIGGNDTDTEIYMTWSDWVAGRDCAWAAYAEDAISLSTIMGSCFPYGLARVGSVYDEIDLNSAMAIRRVDRVSYSAQAEAAAIASGRPWEADENYLYIARETPVRTAVTIDGSYTANDHGLEIFDGTAVEVTAVVLYGENLVDKLRTDVLTISQQTLTDAEKTQVRSNIGAGSAADVATRARKLYFGSTSTIATVYAALSALDTAEVADVYMAGATVAAMTNNALASPIAGTVAKVNGSTYRFSGVYGDNAPIALNQTGMSASSWGTTTFSNPSDQIGAFNYIPLAAVPKSGSQAYTIGNGSAMLLIGTSVRANANFIFLVAVNSAGTAISVSDVFTGSSITYSISGTTLTISNANTEVSCAVKALLFSGSITSVTT